MVYFAYPCSRLPDLPIKTDVPYREYEGDDDNELNKNDDLIICIYRLIPISYRFLSPSLICVRDCDHNTIVNMVRSVQTLFVFYSDRVGDRFPGTRKSARFARVRFQKKITISFGRF